MSLLMLVVYRFLFSALFTFSSQEMTLNLIPVVIFDWVFLWFPAYSFLKTTTASATASASPNVVQFIKDTLTSSEPTLISLKKFLIMIVPLAVVFPIAFNLPYFLAFSINPISLYVLNFILSNLEKESWNHAISNVRMYWYFLLLVKIIQLGALLIWHRRSPIMTFPRFFWPKISREM